MGESLNRLRIIVLLTAVFLCFQTATYARDITLTWDANIEQNLDQYVVYWGTDSNPPFAHNSADKGDFIDENTTTYMVTDLSEENVYYFAVRAFNSAGLGSDYSNIVSSDGQNIQRGSAGAGGGCFIATAAFGSTMDRHVQILCELRERRLATNPIGRSIIRAYYRFSPPFAHYLNDHPFAKALVRYTLIPITTLAFVSLSINPLMAMFAFFALLLAGVYFLNRLPHRRRYSGR